MPAHDGMSESGHAMLHGRRYYIVIICRYVIYMRATLCACRMAAGCQRRESRRMLTTGAMRMPHAEIAHEGSQ